MSPATAESNITNLRKRAAKRHRPKLTKFLEKSLGLLAEHSVDGAIHFVCADWRHLDEMLAAGRRTYRELKNLVVWTKTNAGMGILLPESARTDFCVEEWPRQARQ